jgi:hypothetical protein
MDGNNNNLDVKAIVNNSLDALDELGRLYAERKKLSDQKQSSLRRVDAWQSSRIAEVNKEANSRKSGIERNHANKEASINEKIHTESALIIQAQQLAIMVSQIGKMPRPITLDDIDRPSEVLHFIPLLEGSTALNMYAVIVKNKRKVNNKTLWVIGNGIAMPEQQHGDIALVKCDPYKYNFHHKQHYWAWMPDFSYAVKYSSSVKELLNIVNDKLLPELKSAEPKIRYRPIAEFRQKNLDYAAKMRSVKGAGITLEEFRELFPVWCPHCQHFEFQNRDPHYKQGDICPACKTGKLEITEEEA